MASANASMRARCSTRIRMETHWHKRSWTAGSAAPTTRPCSWRSRGSVRSRNGETGTAADLAWCSGDVLVADDREGVTRPALDERLEILKVLTPLDLLRTQPGGLSRSPGRVRGIST